MMLLFAAAKGKQLNMITSLIELKGVGQALATKLHKLGIYQPTDLLLHLPRYYQDRTKLQPLQNLATGMHCLIEANIAHVEIKFGRRQMLLCHLEDNQGHLTLRFFHFNRQQHQQLQQSSRIRCFGEARLGPNGYEMIHPEYQLIQPNQSLALDHTLTPVYSITEGISQQRLRNLIEQVLAQTDHTQLPDLLPDTLRQQCGFPDILTAIRYLHRPPADINQKQILAGDHPAQQALAFEELLAHRLSLRQLRQKQQCVAAATLTGESPLTKKLIMQLPFELTAAQQKVIQQISTDLAQPRPMLRLVQGDVGSGKTLVAVMAMLKAVEHDYQVALMAPTEILAEQHFENLCQWLHPLNIYPAKLLGKQTAKAKLELTTAIANGDIKVVIGTHALIQETVEFKQLALVVIDEQHRFGVSQRQQLQDKGQNDLRPHQLIMTATPIPRTLAMTAYANLDVSIIDQLPPGRTPVTTALISQQKRDNVIQRVQAACHQGRQVYWVCTLIEDSEALNCQNAEQTTALLQTELKGIQVDLVHGQMKAADKAAAMADFKSGQTQVLVATTVIEVGVDVPNASLMIIENPERLGLAQLHQLRGRVGRGSTDSFCVLLYQPPLSQNGRQRLQIMRQYSDGFNIAEEDLKIRGPGEVLGTRQTGEMSFRLASLIRDQHLLPTVQHFADQLLQDYPERAQTIINRWLGSKLKYGKV